MRDSLRPLGALLALLTILAAGACVPEGLAPTPSAALSQDAQTPTPVVVAPTATFTPTATPSPTAPTSPTPEPTPAVRIVPGPLPPGLKVLFAEGLEGEGKSVIWMANVDDLTQVQIIATFPYRVPAGAGGAPVGRMSPDCSKLAYLLPGVHAQEGTLGVMDADGSDQKTLASPVLGRGGPFDVQWSCDGQWLAYLREDATDPRKTELRALRADGSQDRRLAVGGATLLLGCADNGWLYYSESSQVKRFQIQTAAVEVLGSVGDAAYWGLAPGTHWLALVQRGSVSLEVKPLDGMALNGSQSYTLAQSVEALAFEYDNYNLWPVWSPDGTSVAYNPIVDSTHTEIAVTHPATGETVEVLRPADPAYLYPIAWSPDSRLLVISVNQPLGQQGDYYRALVSLDGHVQRVPTIKPDSLPLRFIGWLEG